MLGIDFLWRVVYSVAMNIDREMLKQKLQDAWAGDRVASVEFGGQTYRIELKNAWHTDGESIKVITANIYNVNDSNDKLLFYTFGRHQTIEEVVLPVEWKLEEAEEHYRHNPQPSKTSASRKIKPKGGSGKQGLSALERAKQVMDDDGLQE
jgi:hypothetical protein